MVLPALFCRKKTCPWGDYFPAGSDEQSPFSIPLGQEGSSKMGVAKPWAADDIWGLTASLK